ncbi:MAG: NAD(P)/FAD-dependent oxidoreductase [Dehalococcoidia bacterium]|nr:NAD(P)/FAD-dependent oxidoreductase [Dehalococcoidia bacterium]
MGERHDVVIVGGGHNGLTVGAYLAKAGVDVCVLERQDIVGGGVATRESTLPGFKHEVGALMHGIIQPNPMIHRDELGLKSKYGLKYIFPDKMFEAVFPDGRIMRFYRDVDRTCESIAEFSERDAEAYRRFFKACNDMLKIASVAMFSPVPKWGAMMSFLDASEEGREFLRVIMSSAADITDEWFENDEVKVAITRFASEVMISPWQKGTGNAMFFISSLHTWGYGLAAGGSGALSNALAACIKDNGSTIKVSSPVKSIKVESGEAKGVILDSGEEIVASKAIVSNLNAKQLFLEMIDPQQLPSNFQEKVRRIKPSTFSAFSLAIATKEAPRFKDGKECDAMFVEISPFLEEYSRIFEDYSHGIPSASMPLLAVPTLHDPSRAPEGKHTVYLYHYEPYNLKDGGPARWDEIKEEMAEGILTAVSEHIANLGRDNILGMNMISPLDIERYNPSMQAGDILHAASFITQSYANRPLPGWGQYRTPIERLYMCGASTHPGGGVTGGGRAAALAVMEDMGIDFRKVVE